MLHRSLVRLALSLHVGVCHIVSVLSFTFEQEYIWYDDIHIYRGPALANWAHYAATSAFNTNSLRRRCCKPIAHCNQSRYSVNLPEKLRLRRKLHAALKRPANDCLWAAVDWLAQGLVYAWSPTKMWSTNDKLCSPKVENVKPNNALEKIWQNNTQRQTDMRTNLQQNVIN